MTKFAALKANLQRRPHWMNALMLFCAYMTFIYLPWDVLLKPLAEDQEVWFGILFSGWAAKAGGLLHWFVYGGGFWVSGRCAVDVPLGGTLYRADRARHDGLEHARWTRRRRRLPDSSLPCPFWR